MNVYLWNHLALALRLPQPHALRLADLLRDDSGQDMIEYALVACFLALSTVTGLNGLASQVSNYVTIVGNAFTSSLPNF